MGKRQPVTQLDGKVECPICGWYRITNKPAEKWYHICKIPKPKPKTPTVKAPRGPGWYLHSNIKKRLGQDAVAGCGCGTVWREMDHLGPNGCRENRERLVAGLVEVATKKDWLIEDIEDAAKEDVGKPVPQTWRTRTARYFARAVKTVGGTGLIEWQCGRLFDLSVAASEKDMERWLVSMSS